MALSDFLSEKADQLRADYIDSEHHDYSEYQAEIDLLLNVMDAVRMLPGLDTSPGMPNHFNRQLDAAITKYRQARPDAPDATTVQ